MSKNNADPVARINEIAEKHGHNKDNSPGESSPSSHKPQPKVIQLPLWAEERRGFPNALARSALFTVRGNKVAREHYKQTQIETYSEKFSMSYTGEELRQDDEDVFQQLLHLARNHDLQGDWIEFSAYSMLKELNRSTSGQVNYERLKDQILRLKANMLIIKGNAEHKSYGASLVRDFLYEEDGENLKRWRVRLEPAIIALFATNNFSLLQWEQRKTLKSDIAKWMISFYVTHEKPYPLKIETVHRLTKSVNKNMKSFKQGIQKALDELIGRGFLERAWIDDNNLIHVRRARS